MIDISTVLSSRVFRTRTVVSDSALLLIVFYSTIFSGIPLLLWTIGFGYLTVVPGFLFLILVTNIRRGWQVLPLSAGLSIWILMFIGLLPTLVRPKEGAAFTEPFTHIVFITVIVALTVGLYYRNPTTKLPLPSLSRFEIVMGSTFPLMAVLGVFVLNELGENALVLAFLLAVPAYAAVIYAFRDSLPKGIYPISALSLGIALSLLFGLRHQNIPTGDISFEYYAYRTVVETGYWTPSLFSQSNIAMVGSLFSVTVLPATYNYLLDVNEGVFLIGYRLLVGIIPLCSYLTFRRFFSSSKAFIASFFIMSQLAFITLIGTMARVEIAFLLFFLFVLVLFLEGIPHRTRSFLLVIFLLLITLSHYATAMLLLLLLVGKWIVATSVTRSADRRTAKENISLPIVILAALFPFLVYNFLTRQPFEKITLTVVTGLLELLQFGLDRPPTSSPAARTAATRLPYLLSFGIYLGSVAIVTLGSIRVAADVLFKKTFGRFNSEFTWLVITAAGLNALMLMATQFYGMYGPNRVFFQFSAILAPMVIVAAETGGEIYASMSRRGLSVPFSKEQVTTFVILVTIILQFLAGSYLIFQLFGVPWAEYANADGVRYEQFYTHDDDIETAKWLAQRSGETPVWSDFYGEEIYSQVDPSDAREGIGLPGFDYSRTEGEYIFLRCYNTNTGKLDSHYEKPVSIEKVDLLENRTLVYRNGCARVYR